MDEELTQADYLDELAAQIEALGVDKLAFYIETLDNDRPLDITNVHFDGTNIIVLFN